MHEYCHVCDSISYQKSWLVIIHNCGHHGFHHIFSCFPNFKAVVTVMKVYVVVGDLLKAVKSLYNCATAMVKWESVRVTVLKKNE